MCCCLRWLVSATLTYCRNIDISEDEIAVFSLSKEILHRTGLYKPALVHLFKDCLDFTLKIHFLTFIITGFYCWHSRGKGFQEDYEDLCFSLVILVPCAWKQTGKTRKRKQRTRNCCKWVSRLNRHLVLAVKCNLKSPRSEIFYCLLMSGNVYHYFWALRGT